MQYFLEDCFTRRILLFFLFLWWTTPDRVHFHPCTLNFDQFYMTWNHLIMSKNNSTASIELLLVSNLSYRQDRIKEKKNCTFFKILRVKMSKLCAETKFYWFLKMYRTCFLHQDFFSLSLDWCLWSHLIQIFLKKCFTRRILPFFLFSVVNYTRSCSFPPMHTQFRSILHDFKSFDQVRNSSAASIELWLVSNSSYCPDKKKEKKNCTFIKNLTSKNFKIVCQNTVLLVLKNVQNLFFTLKFLLSFFRLMSLVSHHPEFLEKMLYKKNSALFLVFCGELLPKRVLKTKGEREKKV